MLFFPVEVDSPPAANAAGAGRGASRKASEIAAESASAGLMRAGLLDQSGMANSLRDAARREARADEDEDHHGGDRQDRDLGLRCGQDRAGEFARVSPGPAEFRDFASGARASAMTAAKPARS